MTDNNRIEYLSDDDETYEDASPFSESDKQQLFNEFEESLKLDDTKNESVKKLKEPETFVDCESNDDRDEDDDDDKQAKVVQDEEIVRRSYEQNLSPEQLLTNKTKADELKTQGNDLFKAEKYHESIEMYTEALAICPLDCANERAILYGNRAAAHIQNQSKRLAIEDCTKALELNPNYMKALIRRARLNEETDKLNESLTDFNRIIELDPGFTEARQAQMRLPPKIEQQNEKLKTEMLSKLKDLGNIVLKPFGLSTDNFQMQQDPSTGSYSVNFRQKS